MGSKCPIEKVPDEALELSRARKLLSENGYFVVPYVRLMKYAWRFCRVVVWYIALWIGLFRKWIDLKLCKKPELQAAETPRAGQIAESPTAEILARKYSEKKCMACQASLVEGARFCRKCGKSVENEIVEVEAGGSSIESGVNNEGSGKECELKAAGDSESEKNVEV